MLILFYCIYLVPWVNGLLGLGLNYKKLKVPSENSASPPANFSWAEVIQLEIKNQHLTYSCASQVIATMVEAYFKRKGLSTKSWSGMDLYVCGLNKTQRLKPQKVLVDMIQQRIHLYSASCPHIKPLNVIFSLACPLRKHCHKPKATIDGYNILQNPSHRRVMSELQRNGPMMVVIELTDAFISFLKTSQLYFRDEDWPVGRKNSVKREAIDEPELHALTLLGWFIHSRDNQVYWIVQNSYGSGTGVKPLFYIQKTSAGILNNNMYSITEASLHKKNKV